MPIIVILKNNTGSNVNIDDMGVTLSSSQVYTATDYFEFVDLTESDDLKTLVSAATITVNDGTTDLSIAKGLEHLEIESVHLDYIQDGDVIISSNLPCAGAFMSTVTQMTDTYVDTIYTDAEYINDPTALTWNISSPTRIQIFKDGLYRVYASFFVRANVPNFIYSYFRIMVNGVQYGNESTLHTYTTEIQQVVVSQSIPLVAGDYITVQHRTSGTDDIDLMESQFNAFKLEGVQGPAGPPGGTTVKVQNEGTLVVDNVAILNFRGNGIQVTQGVTGTALLDINTTAFEEKFFQGYDSVGGININVTTPVSIPIDVQEIRDTDTFSHSTATNNSRVYVLKSGWYDISWAISSDFGSEKTGVQGAIRKNGTTYLNRTRYSNNSNDKSDGCSLGVQSVLVQLNSGDYIELMAFRDGERNDTSITYPDRCWVGMKFKREV